MADRPSSAARGYGYAHRKEREKVLQRDKKCRKCRIRRATIAAHVIPLKRGGATSLSNMLGECATCHGKESVARGESGFKANPVKCWLRDVGKAAGL